VAAVRKKGPQTLKENPTKRQRGDPSLDPRREGEKGPTFPQLEGAR